MVPFSYDGMSALAAVDQRGHTRGQDHMHGAWPGDGVLDAQHREVLHSIRWLAGL